LRFNVSFCFVFVFVFQESSLADDNTGTDDVTGQRSATGSAFYGRSAGDHHHKLEKWVVR